MPVTTTQEHEAAGPEAVLQILTELLPAAPAPRARLTPDASFDRDLGLDSLSRMELIRRVEDRFGVTLPEASLEELNCARELWEAIAAAKTGALGMIRRAGVVQRAAVGSPARAETLLDVLRWHAEHRGARRYITFFEDHGDGPTLSFGELYARSAETAAGLQEAGVEPGERVALMLPTSQDYFFAYFGTLLAGAVPVPIYPPARRSEIEDHMRRQRSVLDNAGAAMLITVPEGRNLARLSRAMVPSLREIRCVEELAGNPSQLQHVARRAEDIALLQYTSGSTGTPKGVILTHANLLANIRAASGGVQATGDDVFVSWLPLYHDMGLIGACLATLYNGIELVLMSPIRFLTRPQRWLWAIHRHRGTLSAAPNFAYELCLAKIDDKAIEGLDLSSWRLSLNGAEAVSPHAVEGFCERFAPYGFRRETMYPVYGLAENAVALAFPPPGSPPHIDAVQREALARTGIAAPAPADDPAALRFVCCGQAVPDHEIRIVDATGVEVGEREQGRIQFRGPSATSGYFNNPEATRRLFRGGWLETGDLGYFAEGGLYITGRSKDIVIRRGRNIYPDEIERAVGELAGVRRGRVAAFGSPDPANGGERLVVVAELHPRQRVPEAELLAEINRICSEVAGSPPDAAQLVPAGTILKTSSGKLRREACRTLFETGKLEHEPPRPWRQFGHLMLAALPGVAYRVQRNLGRWLYNAWAWSVFYLAHGLLWVGVMAWPGRAGRWRMAHFTTRAVLALIGGAPRIVHAERLRGLPQPVVVVANHSSYLDTVLMTALVPWPACFVAHRELGEQRWVRRFYERIGAVFVERFDVAESVRDAGRVADLLRSGSSLIVFPEGRLAVIPELLPFRMGAFLAATQSGATVLPVALVGAREFMKGDRRMLRRVPLEIHVCEPIAVPRATADPWGEARAVSERARSAIEAALAGASAPR
jgi:acyl carrier protein